MHFSEAVKQAEDRNELLVNVDELIWRGKGRGLTVLHVIAPSDYYQQAQPPAYVVQLIRPIWDYGTEGQFCTRTPLRYVGCVDDMEIDEIPEDDSPLWDQLPGECACGHMWAISNEWKRCRIPFWDYFREAADPT